MKKVFLSLATIAFVAVGSLTMTSCGSDDSTTPEPEPGNHAGKINVDGKDYGLDTTDALVFTQKNEQGQNLISLYKVPLAPGDTIYASKWIVQSYAGEDAQSAQDLQVLQFYVKQDMASENVTLPNETEDLYVLGGGVVVGGNEVDLGEANVEMNFNVFVWDEASSIDYNTTLAGSKTAKLSFKGDLGVYATAEQSKKSSNKNLLKLPINTTKVSKQNMQIAK